MYYGSDNFSKKYVIIIPLPLISISPPGTNMN